MMPVGPVAHIFAQQPVRAGRPEEGGQLDDRAANRTLGRDEEALDDIAEAVGALDAWTGEPADTTGTIVRMITFQSRVIETGITGWMLRYISYQSFLPMPKSQLFCNGT